MVVDDDENFRSAFVDLLRDEGWSVMEASGGHAALEVLERTGGGNGAGTSPSKDRTAKPDLIVMDLMMPSMSGSELLRRLRDNPRLQHIPVMVVTAANDPMLTVRLDAPVANKLDIDTVCRQIRRQLHANDTHPPAHHEGAA
jgi:CheY-like chemotaxis protein